jgi:hypothetical protein
MTQFRHAFSLDKQELNEMAPPGTVTLMGEWRTNIHDISNNISNHRQQTENSYEQVRVIMKLKKIIST